jgi:hypothetical protein
MTQTQTQTRIATPHPMTDVVRGAIIGSPLAALLKMELVDVADDVVRVKLPFRDEVTTIGSLVHGGAIAALVDVSATAAAWTKADLMRSPRGRDDRIQPEFPAGRRRQRHRRDGDDHPARQVGAGLRGGRPQRGWRTRRPRHGHLQARP